VRFLDKLKSVAALAGEYHRAVAATRRYDDLKSGRAPATRRQDIPRQIFEEFYAPIGGNSGRRPGYARHLPVPPSIATKPIWPADRNGLDQGPMMPALPQSYCD
jgi:hypothetical protein